MAVSELVAMAGYLNQCALKHMLPLATAKAVAIDANMDTRWSLALWVFHVWGFPPTFKLNIISSSCSLDAGIFTPTGYSASRF